MSKPMWVPPIMPGSGTAALVLLAFFLITVIWKWANGSM